MESLLDLMHEARDLGFLGPGPVADQVERALAFAKALDPPDGLAVDLGSGGGLPGLVLALHWDASNWLLLDANRRRTDWLRVAASRLSLDGRVTVICDRAESFGRGQQRASACLVVSRGFGPPAVTAECASPLLVQGGTLAVADPPGADPSRWPAPPLLQLGLEPIGTQVAPVAISLFRQVGLCPDRYPRRVGIPGKRPLF
jgi:16S rRNA (guanine527-N7)-methyltransferase